MVVMLGAHNVREETEEGRIEVGTRRDTEEGRIEVRTRRDTEEGKIEVGTSQIKTTSLKDMACERLKKSMRSTNH